MAGSSLSEYLTRLFENCLIYEELPHSVDDSIMDRLVDSIQFDADTLAVVRRLMRDKDLEGCRTIPAKLIIRLAGAALSFDNFIDEEPLRRFLLGTEVLLGQRERPAALLSTLFQFYAHPIVFAVRRADQWSAVTTYALSGIADESRTIFLRRDFGTFLQCFTREEARNLMIISGILQIFVARIANGSGSGVDSVIDETTRLLNTYYEILALEECEMLIDAVRHAGVLGERTLNLVVKLKLHHNGRLKVSLTPGSWANEKNRVNVVCSLLENDDSSDDVVMRDDVNVDDSNSPRSTVQLIGMVLYSPACTLYQKARILHKMNNTQVLDVYSEVMAQVKVEGAVSMSDVTCLLTKLSERITFPQMAKLFEAIGARAIENLDLLRKLRVIYGPDVLQRAEFARVKAALRSEVTDSVRKGAQHTRWEPADTALEVIKLFPFLVPEHEDIEALGQNALRTSSPYVLSGVLELLRDHFGGIPDEYIKECMHRLYDSRPRVICMKYLSTTAKLSTLEAGEIEEYLQVAFTDNDVELRKEALELAELALPKYREKVTEVLNEYKNDRLIGRAIKRLLHEDHVQEESKSIQLIREMMASIHVAGNNADDVKDCY